MQHTPLDPALLSTAAQRALGPGPGRMMASRGMLPLPPADQVAVLYQLSIDADAMLAQTSRATAAGLPGKLLSGTLADPTLDPRILDFFAELAGEQVAVFDAVALNPTTADTTIATLAARGGAREVDLLAQNEQRILRHPEIIAAMYLNRKARMSTIDRVVELAVRNGVRVPGLAAWDEIARALTGSPAPASESDDALFARAADAMSAEDPAAAAPPPADDDALVDAPPPEPPKDVPINAMSIPAKIRLAQLGNASARAVLIRDPVKLVSMSAIKSGGVSENEALNYVRNQSINEDVIRYIATKREWTKDQRIRAALCRNPKTPISEASRLLPFLRERELENLARSKGVPSALVAQARKLMMQRKGGSGK